ncbi:MAG: hypothetical protein IPK83_13385 [Planctomycetes bacterium]|nr:hypothetical protein [Planctomycetota bacterium]
MSKGPKIRGAGGRGGGGSRRGFLARGRNGGGLDFLRRGFCVGESELEEFLEDREELFWGWAEFFGEFGEFDEDFGEFIALAGCHAFVEGSGDAGEHAFFGSLHVEEAADFLAYDGENEGGRGEVLGRAGEDVGELFEHGLKRQKVKKSKRQNKGTSRRLRPAGVLFPQIKYSAGIGGCRTEITWC